MIYFFTSVFSFNNFIDVKSVNDAFRLRLRNFRRDLIDREPIRVEEFDKRNIQLVDEFAPYIDKNGNLGTKKTTTRIQPINTFRVENINQYAPTFEKSYRAVLY